VYYDTRDRNGFASGLNSGNHLGFNMYCSPAPFNLPTAYTVYCLRATATWRNDMNVRFLGHDKAGSVVHSKTITPFAARATLSI
jgi:hypothetical protein